MAALDSCGMRLLVDIVPNHMAAHPANRWWWDVLGSGSRSEYAAVFDIDWEAQDYRVLVPTLSRPLRELYDTARVPSRDAEAVLELDGQAFPLAAGSEAEADLAALIDRQHYRPAYWRLSADEGNYRRFFDIDGLIGVRVEDPAVFERTQGLVVELCSDERIAGVRVDHIDGLADPASYLGRLAGELAAEKADPVVLVEKILSSDETLRDSWAVDGTTGYEFANVAGGLFVHEQGARLLARLGVELTGEPQSFAELSRQAKREVLASSFRAPLERLGRLAMAGLDHDEPGHDLSLRTVCDALAEMTVELDVYRTYLDDGAPEPTDRARLDRLGTQVTGYSEARRAARLITRRLLEVESSVGTWRDVARRWRQLSGAVMAKGVEDTATYRYSGLLSHAEVGCDPARASATPGDFSRLVRARRRHPASLNAASTHDSKRNEDARSRLFVLSEAAEQWSTLVRRRWHRRHATAGLAGPDAHDELLVYQSLVSLWPFGASKLSRVERRRVQDYALKAAREARRRTSWTDPDRDYEAVLKAFIDRLADEVAFADEMLRLVSLVGPVRGSPRLRCRSAISYARLEHAPRKQNRNRELARLGQRYRPIPKGSVCPAKILR